MKKLKLAHRLFGGFSLVLGGLFLLGMMALSTTHELERQAKQLTMGSLARVHLLGQIATSVQASFDELTLLARATDRAQEIELEGAVSRRVASVSALLQQYEATATTEEARRTSQALVQSRTEWSDTRDAVRRLVSAGQKAEAQQVIASGGRRGFERFFQAIEEQQQSNKREGDALGSQIADNLSGFSRMTIVTMVLWLLLGVPVVVTIGRSVTKPVGVLVEHVSRVGQGDLTARCDYSGRDEVGMLADALNKMTDDLRAARDKDHARAEQQSHDKQELQERVDKLLQAVRRIGDGQLDQPITVKGPDAVGQLGEGIDQLVHELNGSLSAIARSAQTLASSADRLSTTSRQMTGSTEQTSEQAAGVSAAAEQVSRSVQTVATSAEEMNASVREIAKSVHEATKITGNAVRTAETTNAIISKLGDSSKEIGNVIKLITSIAEQTNLLALNATIEAARAGEAGKGFAVVANEVKDLARETAKATDDIGRRIDAIQHDAAAAIRAIEGIRQVIGQIDDISTTIAGAVEEQTATTNEIGRNVGEAARATSEIASNITLVADAARETASGASESLSSATSLSQMAAELKALVGRFRLREGQAAAVTNVVALNGASPPPAGRRDRTRSSAGSA